MIRACEKLLHKRNKNVKALRKMEVPLRGPLQCYNIHKTFKIVVSVQNYFVISKNTFYYYLEYKTNIPVV